MNCLVKPHVSMRAHRIAKYAANSGDPSVWKNTYRNVYEAVCSEGEGVPLWMCIALIAVSLIGGYLVRCLQ